MAKGHSDNGIIEHENEAYEQALKYVKEDVVMQAIMETFSEKVTEKLNDSLYIWDSNQRRLENTELWLLKIGKIYLIPIMAFFAFIGVIILFIEIFSR